MKLLFGIRTSEAVSLSITTQAKLSEQPPSLMIRPSGGPQDTAVFCSGNTWAATLNSGDHVIYMAASGDSWFDGPVSFTFSAPVMIVALTSSQALQAWTAAKGTVGANPLDAKNPLPPPGSNVESAPPLDAAWLTSTLVEMNAGAQDARSAPDRFFQTPGTPAGRR